VSGATSRRPSHLLPLALLVLTGLTPSGCAGVRAQDPEPAAPAEQDPTRPEGFEALLRRAQEADRRGDTATAAEAFARLSRARPDDASLAVKAGETLGAAGRLNDALTLLVAGRSRFPEVPDFGTLLARTLLLKAEEHLRAGSGFDLNVRGYFEQAVEVCAEVVAAHPDERDAHLIRAQALYQLGQIDEARAAAEVAQDRFPTHPGGANLLGRIAFDACRNATAALQRDALTDEERAAVLDEQSAARDRARAAFGRAIALDPDRAFPHRMLGDLAVILDDTPAALAHYRTALSVDPSAPIDHAWLERHVAIAERVALYEGARDDLAAAAPAAQRGVLEWYRAKALLDGGEFAQAREGFERALASRPDDLSGHYFAMVAAWWDGDTERATQHAAAHAAADPVAFADTIRALPERSQKDIVDALRWMAADARSKDRAAPCRDLNQVLAYTLQTADEWNNFALLCWEGGQHEAAYGAYLKALEVEPDSPQLLNDAGAVLHYHLATPENLLKARAFYEKAIERAGIVLSDPQASAGQKENASTARDNARKNLTELDG